MSTWHPLRRAAVCRVTEIVSLSVHQHNAAEGVRFPRSLKSVLFLAVSLAGVCAAPAHAADPVAATAAASVGAFDAVPTTALQRKADPMFRTLFDSWKKMDVVPHGGFVAVPSQKPVKEFRYTSGFGVRGNPFSGHGGEMHPGMDMAAPTGTPVYATADGMVSRAERAGGYGNLIQLEHGKGLESRYGHLSEILVHDGQRVHRGDLIGLVGSTGRSTGSHLHYEVRIDGRAVNPMPFLQTSDYLVALENRAAPGQPGQPAVAMGGPEDPDQD